MVSNPIAPRTLNRPHSITATVDIANGAEVSWSRRDSTGGYALYVKDHKLHYAYNFLGVRQFHLVTDTTVGDGRHELPSSSNRPASPTWRTGRNTRARATLR